MGDDCSVWFSAVIRADVDGVRMGNRVNVQDNACIHQAGGKPVVLEDDVTLGHGAIVHGCTVGSNTLIGMGAIILNGAVIGDNCIIGAGALVTQNTHIPDGSLAFGNPAKVIRSLTPEEIRETGNNAQRYVNAAKAQLREVNCE